MGLGNRRVYLGASEWGQALGLYGSRRELWAYKTGRIGAQPHKKIFDRGHDMEAIMIKLLEQDHGLHVEGRQREFAAVLSGRPWLKCHVDAVCPDHVPPKHLNGDGVKLRGWGTVELKAPGARAVDTWKETGMPDDYVLQTQAQLYCANNSKDESRGAFLWSRFAFLDYETYTLPCFDQEYDQRFVEGLLPGLDEFWHCVETDTPPPDVQPKAIEIPQVDGTLHVAEEGTDLHNSLSLATEHYIALEAAKTLYDQAREIAKAEMGDISKVKVPDFATVSYYWNKGKRTVREADLLRWAGELCIALVGASPDPDTAIKMAQAWSEDLFTTQGEPFRTFRITPTGDGKKLYQVAKEAAL